MKYFLSLLTIALLTFQPLAGTHFIASTFSYESLGPNTVRVHLWSYQECGGPNMPGTQFNYNITQTSTGSGCTLATPGTSVSLPATDVTPICPGVGTTCDSSNTVIYGVLEGHNYVDYDFTSANCPDYSFGFSNCCRNGAIVNVANPFATGIYGSLTLYPNAIGQSDLHAWRAQAPRFLELPASGSDTFFFDLGIHDPDADSLIYSLSAPFASAGNQITYVSGYWDTNPMGSGYDVTLDPATGFMRIIASSSSPLMNAAIGFTCSEHRNGQEIARVNREFTLITTSNGSGPAQPSTFPSHTGLTSVSAGTILGSTFFSTGDTAFIPATGTTCIEYGFVGAAPAVITEVTGYYFGGGTYSFNDLGGTPTNPAYGTTSAQQFCFTPPGPGTYEFTVGLRDTTCNFPAQVFQTYTVIVGDTSLVWPGDANNDLIANNLDVLAIGLASNATGPTRTNASTNWIGQVGLPWVDTINGGIDQKFQDSDGNGVVNGLDISVVGMNYGLTHNKTGGAQGTQTDPPLTLAFAADSFQVGDTVHVDINLGDANIQAQNVYGIAFSVLYDPTLVDSNSFSLDFANSWIGSGLDVYDLQYDMYNNGQMDGAIVRNDHTAMNGMGKICKATFVIIDNIDGKKETLLTDTLTLSFANVHVITADGALIPVNPSGDDAIVFESITDLTVPVAPALELYPNPTRDRIQLRSDGEVLESIEIVDLNGRILRSFQPGTQDYALEIGDLPASVYYLRIARSSGMSIHKVFKQ